MKSAIDSVVDKTSRTAIFDALAGAIADEVIAHLKTFGVVVVTSVSGVTTGAGVSGPGTGTIT